MLLRDDLLNSQVRLTSGCQQVLYISTVRVCVYQYRGRVLEPPEVVTEPPKEPLPGELCLVSTLATIVNNCCFVRARTVEGSWLQLLT